MEVTFKSNDAQLWRKRSIMLLTNIEIYMLCAYCRLRYFSFFLQILKYLCVVHRLRYLSFLQILKYLCVVRRMRSVCLFKYWCVVQKLRYSIYAFLQILNYLCFVWKLRNILLLQICIEKYIICSKNEIFMFLFVRRMRYLCFLRRLRYLCFLKRLTYLCFLQKLWCLKMYH